jgi:multidrug efflux system outer membrane protein
MRGLASIIHHFIIIVIIIFLTGCALGPNFKKPQVETPVEYRDTDSLIIDTLRVDTLTNLKWWELFGEPVLDSLVKYALQNNKDLLIAASRIEEARALYGFTKADIYPRLDLQAGASRGNFPGGLIQTETEENNFFISPILSWEIDFWGKYRRANEAAKSEMLASLYSYHTVQLGLISEVVSTYFFLLDYHRRLDISKQTLESRLKGLDIIQKRFDKGIIPEIDLNQAQIQKEIAESSIPVYERLISLTENALSILLGNLPTNISQGKDLNDYGIPPEIPAGLPSSLLERRPDIIQAQYQLKAQNARIGVATAQLLPSISLTALFGATSNELSTLLEGDPAWSIGGTLFGPLFSFNKNRRRIDIEEERTRQALLNYENTVLTAFREVEDALVQLATYKKQLTSVERKYRAAANAEKLSINRYDKGVTSYLEVLETQRQLFSVQLELSELTQQYFNSYVKLYKALGGGWLAINGTDQK